MSKIDHEHYQEGKIIFQLWKLSVMKSTDGAGTIWLVFRLYDGNEDKREYTDLSQEYGA